MNKNTEIMCAWGGVVFAVLLGIGMLGMTNWLRPMDPNWTAAQVASVFQLHALKIQFGSSVMAIGAVFFWPFSVSITTQMRRIEGGSHPLATTQLATSSGTVLTILFASFIWLALAFRPDVIAPGTLQTLNDFCWMGFVGLYPPGSLECALIGICILSGKDTARIYPRWLGWFNIVIAILFLPGITVSFFKTGPWAWNGLITFWLVALAFFGWILVMSWATIRAVRMADDVAVARAGARRAAPALAR